jgi:long-chain fatty acid transport protein
MSKEGLKMVATESAVRNRVNGGVWFHQQTEASAGKISLSRGPGRQTAARGSFRAKVLVLLAALLILGTLQVPAWGAGFTVFHQGTGAMAQGNAFVAEADDPSAIFYNPAGLNQLKKPEVYFMGLLNAPDREFHGPAGQFSQTNHRIFKSGAFYATYPFNDAVSVGIGLFSPFGLASHWPPTWEGRYLTTFGSLKTYNLNPVISIKPFNRFSVAFGLNVLWTSVELKRKIPVAIGPFTLPDGESYLSGDSQGFGFNLGALLEVVDGVKVGLSYRSHIAVNYKGDLELTLPSLIPGPRKIPATAHLTFPPFVTAGISVSRFKPFVFNFDATWTGWSSFDEIRVNLSQPIIGATGPTSTVLQPKNWHNSWTFRFGMNYQVTQRIKLRAGYTYDLSPIPDETFDPQIPNANQHIFAVGGDVKINRFTLGLAYSYVLAEDRTKNNMIGFNGVPVPQQANGLYKSDAHSLGVSLAYHF